MKFEQPLQRAILHQRYKRFLADVEISATGQIITAHCPNTGAMTGCAEPGMTVWLSQSQAASRKYPYTWELAETASGAWICIHTQRSNQLAAEALQQGCIPELSAFRQWQREVPYADGKHRIDLKAQDAQGHSIWVEVKSVTLADQTQPTLGYFPDTRSDRACAHVAALQRLVEQGQRAVVLYVVLHSDIRQVQAAAHIDPRYGQAVQAAVAAGVEFYALGCAISAAEIQPVTSLPVAF